VGGRRPRRDVCDGPGAAPGGGPDLSGGLAAGMAEVRSHLLEVGSVPRA
jgi:hypothetical protein